MRSRILVRSGRIRSFAWDEDAGVNGEVFVGTYPGCNVIRYRPGEGFSDIGHGAVAAGENYARSVAFNPATGKIYVGVGSHAHLIELDPKTGEKTNILPAKYADHEFCYTVNIAGGKLFALVTNPPEALVIDPTTHEVEATLSGVLPQMMISPKSPIDDKVYYNSDGKLAWYDVKSRQHGMAALDEAVTILAMTWIEGHKLAIFSRPGKLTIFDPSTGQSSGMDLEFPAEATPIHSLCCGPDGRIYSGGYLSGGLALTTPRPANTSNWAASARRRASRFSAIASTSAFIRTRGSRGSIRPGSGAGRMRIRINSIISIASNRTGRWARSAFHL